MSLTEPRSVGKHSVGYYNGSGKWAIIAIVVGSIFLMWLIK